METGKQHNLRTFKEWLKVKEGLWLTDGNAEQTSGGVRAQRKSKPATTPTGGAGGMPGMPPMAAPAGGGMGGPGLSMPPR